MEYSKVFIEMMKLVAKQIFRAMHLANDNFLLTQHFEKKRLFASLKSMTLEERLDLCMVKTSEPNSFSCLFDESFKDGQKVL